MNTIKVIGLDLAKNIFQAHGIDEHGKIILRKKMKRDQVPSFFANLPSCLVGLEACATSAYWARVIESCGHTVHRIHPRFVKPYLMNNKNDANDAAAICEAVQRPHMHFVPHKSQEQADIQSIHRVREGFVKARTATINQIRGLLAENGIVIKQGACHVRKELPSIIDNFENELSSIMRQLLQTLYEYITILDDKIAEQEKFLTIISQENDACKRLMKMPGIGLLTGTVLLTATGRIGDFQNGREFSAFLGLVPRQHSSGGKSRLLGITKRGNGYVRTFLIHGARAVIRSIKMGGSPLGKGSTSKWIADLLERKGYNLASVALANKMARIAWCMLMHGSEYKQAS